MSTTMSDSTETDFNPSAWDNIRWHVGYRTNKLGDHLLKLGDRLCGDVPMGMEEYGDFSYAWGMREGMKAASK